MKPYRKDRHYHWPIHFALMLAVLSLAALAPTDACADCLVERSNSYTAWVEERALEALEAAHVVAATGNPAAEAAAAVTVAATAAAVAGTITGELINAGKAIWWDPEIQVFPNNPGNIVTAITDAQIHGISNQILGAISNGTTLADIQELNNFFPGMGDAADALLLTGVRAYSHVLQGAAAFAISGTGAPDVLAAAALLKDDMASYRAALSSFAPFLDEIPYAAAGLSPIPSFSSDDYLKFLSDVNMNGASELPLAELSVGESIISLASVHLQNTTLTDAVLAVLSEGDTFNEAALLGLAGLTPRQLLEMGAEQLFIGDPTISEICGTCIPEPSSAISMMSGVGSLVVVGFLRRPRTKSLGACDTDKGEPIKEPSSQPSGCVG